jgi:paraquat-inducible protein B
LPTIPSDIDLLKANVTSVLQSIAKLPLDQIASQSLEAVKTANQLIANLDARIAPLADKLQNVSDQAASTLKEAQSRLELRDGEPMQNLNKALVDAQQLINDVDDGVAPLVSSADKLIKATLATLEQAQSTLRTAQSTVSPDSSLYFQVNRTLHEIQTMSNSIRAFADYMQRHPDALLTGKR